jgi:hypothetical protein
MTATVSQPRSLLGDVKALIAEVEYADPLAHAAITDARELVRGLDPDFPGIEQELDSCIRRVFPDELHEAAKEYFTRQATAVLPSLAAGRQTANPPFEKTRVAPAAPAPRPAISAPETAGQPGRATEGRENPVQELVRRVEATQRWADLGERRFGKQAQQLVRLGILNHCYEKGGYEIRPSIETWVKLYRKHYKKGSERSIQYYLKAAVEAGVLNVEICDALRKPRIYTINPAIFDQG